MRRALSAFLSVLICTALLLSCVAFAFDTQERAPLQVGVVSDIHYFAKKMTGNWCDAFMQFADFSAARADISAELRRLTDGGYLTSQQAESVDLDRAAAFINSPLVTRCLSCEAVYKEYRFNINIPASAVDPDIDALLE